MTQPITAEDAAPVEYGWQVVDPDGNVIESGTGVVMQATAGTEEDQ